MRVPGFVERVLPAVVLRTLPPDRFLKWAITGTLTVTIDVLLFRALYPLTHSVFIANAISMPVTTSFNYLLHHRWSFRATRGHAAATPRFGAALVIGYLLNSALVTLALAAGASPTLAKLCAFPIQAPINFVILNRWVFHPSRGAAE